MSGQNKNLRLTFIAAIIFLLILSVVTYTRLTSLIESGQTVNHTAQITLELEKTISSLKDAETGHRGYLLTHDARFLEPFNNGLKEYPLHIQNLKELIKNNPAQQENLKIIQTLAEHRKEYLFKMLEVDKINKPTADELLIGKSIMDSLRKQVNLMADIENGLQENQTKQLQKQMFFAPAMIFLLSVIAFLILIISYRQLNRSLLDAQELRKDVVIKNVQIEKNKQIEASQKELQSLIKQAPVAITLLEGENLTVKVANETALQLAGKTEQEVVNKPMSEIFPEFKELENSYKSVFLSGISYDEKEVKLSFNRFGEYHTGYYDLNFLPWYSSDGNIKGLIGICVDVSEKIAARNKIEESKRLYETITQNTPDLIYVFDLNYRFTYANDALLKMWGRTWDSAIGKGMLENGYEPWHAEMHEREINQVIATKKAIRGEVSFPHATLGLRIYDYIFAPVLDSNGKVEAIAGTTRDITQLVEARKRIEESELRFRNMVAQAPVAICILSGENYVVEVANEKQLELWGKIKEDVLNIPIFSAIPEGRGQGFEKLLGDVFTTGESYFANELPTTLIRNGKKEVFYANFIYKPLYDNQHRIEGIISIATDVTEHVISRKKIEESEQRFRLAIAGSSQIVFSQDKNLKHTWIYNTHPDFKAEDIMGKSDEELHAPQAAAVLTAIKQRTLDTGIPFNGDIEIDVSGQKINYTMHIEAVKDSDKNTTGIIGSAIDITERIKTQQKIRESEQKFRLLADSMPQHIWTSDTQGNLNYYNQSVFDYSGLTLEQINKDGWIQIVHPEDREENINQWANAISSGKDFIFEHRFRRYDGEYRWQLSRAIPQKDEIGNIQMWVGTSTDIQDQKTFAKELEWLVGERTKALEQSNIELQKMNRELQSFAYISSHDLQEPLRKIQTFASRILEKEQNNLSEYGKENFNRMQNAAKRMQTLIQDLLAYSRTNETERVFEPTDLNKIIAEVKDDFMEVLKEKQATIEVNHLCIADIIPFQFRQLMHNLIANSLKFSKPENPPHIQIKSEIENGKNLGNAKLSSNEKYCHISVTDNGIGFEPQYSEKIFEVFQRLHGKNEYSGTGIGLAIVKKIVENHNGIIIANGQLNKGATFDIYIPAT